MHPSTVYAVCLAGCAAALLLRQSGNTVGRWTYYFYAHVVCKRLVFPLLLRRQSGSVSVTRLDALMLGLGVAANGVCLAVGVHSRDDLRLRAAQLCAINMCILFVGGRTNIILDRAFHIPLQRTQLIHRWVGRISAVEGVLHAALGAAASSSTSQKLGTPLLIVLCILTVSSSLPVRRFAFELFLKTHQGLAAATLALFWLHVGTKPRAIGFQSAIAASALWLGHSVTWLLLFVHRNGGSGSNHVSVGDAGVGARLLTVTLRRPIHVQSGGYVYLTIPHQATRSYGFPQAHPYYVVRTSGVDDRDAARQIDCLVAAQAGASGELGFAHGRTVWVDGPYGRRDFGEFDKVMLLANGIGITAYILTIRDLLHAHARKRARVRRIVLVWLLNTKGEEPWAEELLGELMALDEGRCMVSFIYRSEPRDCDLWSDADPAHLQFGGRRILDVISLMNIEWTGNAGNMVVSVCGPPEFENAVRQAVSLYEPDIQLDVADFLPDETVASAASRSRFQHGAQRKAEPHALSLDRARGEQRVT